MKLRNVNPIGHVDVPLLYRQGEPFDQEGIGCLQPGEVFDCTAEQARQLLPQIGNYEPADGEAQQVLDDLAAEAVSAAQAALAAAEQNTSAGSGEPVTPTAGPVSGDGSGTSEPPAAGQPAGTSDEGTA